MNTLDDMVLLAKRTITTSGMLEPILFLDGTIGTKIVPLPNLPEPMKLSILEGLGYTVAVEHQVGELVQLFMISEAWRSLRNEKHPALRPQHDPDRAECMMIFHYDLRQRSRKMVIYDLVRDSKGELTELKPFNKPESERYHAESQPMEAIVRGYTRGAS